MDAFTHHDDQSEWAPLVLELIDNGIDMAVACQEARAELEPLLAYAAEWDSAVAAQIVRSN